MAEAHATCDVYCYRNASASGSTTIYAYVCPDNQLLQFGVGQGSCEISLCPMKSIPSRTARTSATQVCMHDCLRI
jgi:hypothetical protein